MKRGYLKEQYSPVNLCDFMKGEMKRKHITQRRAAEALGMSQGMLSRKLKDGSITLKELKGLMLILDVSGEQMGGLL